MLFWAFTKTREVKLFMEDNKAIFVGHFSSENAIVNPAASIAGDLVQNQIIKDSKDSLGKAFCYIAMEPTSSWPKGPLWIKSKRLDVGYFPAFLNFPVLKNIQFSLILFLYILKLKPKVIVQYNSYFFENLMLLLARFLIKTRLIMIIQDFRIGNVFSKLARWHDKSSNLLVKFYDKTIPVTEKFAKDLKLKKGKYHVFPGGVTKPGFEFLKERNFSQDYAVFAGALEPHNGIDKLISIWQKKNINIKLHVFGRGSLSEHVKKVADNNANIIFHGFISQEEVSKWQLAAKFNFCLRYSDGLEEEYFFPSKFFNVACCPGLLICNDFKNLPQIFFNKIGLVKHDISDLKDTLEITTEEIVNVTKERRLKIINEYSWANLMKQIYDFRGNPPTKP